MQNREINTTTARRVTTGNEITIRCGRKERASQQEITTLETTNRLIKGRRVSINNQSLNSDKIQTLTSNHARIFSQDSHAFKTHRLLKDREEVAHAVAMVVAEADVEV